MRESQLRREHRFDDEEIEPESTLQGVPGKRNTAYERYAMVVPHAAALQRMMAPAPASTPAPLPVSSRNQPWLGARHAVQCKAADGRHAVQRKAAEAGHPVQCKEVDEPALDPFDIQITASQGIAGPARRLPHLGRIQESFGRHDVSGVEAHVGGAATAAAERMGALAYATGNQVAFRETPDLHTAAHEAAHVVQQRGGVQLAGGVGQAGDPYEKHADRVADAVVRGERAESLLDEAAPSSTRSGSKSPDASAVQHKSDTEAFAPGQEQGNPSEDNSENTPGSPIELTYKGKEGRYGAFSGTLTIARKSRLRLPGKNELGDRGEVEISALDNKVAIERSRADKAVASLGLKLLKAGFGAKVFIPGLKVKVISSILPGKLAKGAVKLDAAAITVSVEGNLTELYAELCGIAKQERADLDVKIKGSFTAKLPMGDAVRLVQIARNSRKLTRHGKALAAYTEELALLTREKAAVQKELATEFRVFNERARARFASRADWLRTKRAMQEQLSHYPTLTRELSEKIATEKRSIGLAARAMKAARAGLKSAIGKSAAEAIERGAKKALAKLIPIVNIISTLGDVYEVVTGLVDVLRGAAELGLGGGGEAGGTAEDGSSTAPENDEENADGGADGEPDTDGDGSGDGDGGGDASADARSRDEAGVAGDAHGSDRGAREQGAHSQGSEPGPVANQSKEGSAGPNAEGGTRLDGDNEHGSPSRADSVEGGSLDEQVELHPGAQAVLDLLRSDVGVIELGKEDLENLNDLIPRDLDAAEVHELAAKMRKRAGKAPSDPFELIGRVYEEIRRIRSSKKQAARDDASAVPDSRRGEPLGEPHETSSSHEARRDAKGKRALEQQANVANRGKASEVDSRDTAHDADETTQGEVAQLDSDASEDPAFAAPTLADARRFTRWDAKRGALVENTAATSRYENKVFAETRSRDGYKVGVRAIEVLLEPDSTNANQRTDDEPDAGAGSGTGPASAEPSRELFQYTIRYTYVVLSPELPEIQRSARFAFSPPEHAGENGTHYKHVAGAEIGAAVATHLQVTPSGEAVLRSPRPEVAVGDVRATLDQLKDDLAQKFELNGHVYHRLQLRLVPTYVPNGELLWQTLQGGWERVRLNNKIWVGAYVLLE